VNSFHRWGLREENLPPLLRLAATGPDNTVEAIRHVHHCQAAVMWHPERGEPDPRDVELIRAFFGVER
jgi:gamma-glutamyl-gamma-aminobutyrate hydrolase PuuD